MSDLPVKPVLVMPKPWYQSKTIWANGLTMAAALLMFLNTAQAAGELPFNLDSRWVIFALGLLNFGLRWITTAPVEGGPGT